MREKAEYGVTMYGVFKYALLPKIHKAKNSGIPSKARISDDVDAERK